MKKTLWGYSTKEVDQIVETLSNQNASLIQHNDYMEDAMKDLRNQLDEAKSAIAAGMTQADADNYKELKFAYAALQESNQHSEEKVNAAMEEAETAKSEMAKANEDAEAAKAEMEKAKQQAEAAKKEAESAKAETEKFKAELESAKTELESAVKTNTEEFESTLSKLEGELSIVRDSRDAALNEAVKAKDELEDIRRKLDLQTYQIETLKTALEEEKANPKANFSEFEKLLTKTAQSVSETKEATKVKMTDTKDEFVDSWAGANTDLEALLSKVDAANEEVYNQFRSAAESLLQAFVDFRKRSEEMHGTIAEIGKQKDDKSKELEKIIAKLDIDNPDDEANGELIDELMPKDEDEDSEETSAKASAEPVPASAAATSEPIPAEASNMMEETEDDEKEHDSGFDELSKLLFFNRNNQ